MGKLVHDNVLDAALSYLATNGDRLTVCDAEPASYAAANTGGGNNLASHDLTGGDYSNANGDTSGRKATIAAQNGIEVLATGTASHVAILDTSNTLVLVVTTCTSQLLTDGNDVNVPAFDFEILDPA